jgi:hypothetical protein
VKKRLGANIIAAATGAAAANKTNVGVNALAG